MSALVSPIGWMLIGVGGVLALGCVAIVVAALVSVIRNPNPIKESFDVDDSVFNSHPEEKK